MNLSKNSWHYRLWASTYDKGGQPDSTDLCRYCHRVFWKLVLWAFLVCFIASAIAWACYLFLYQGLYLHTVSFLVAMAIVASILGTIVWYVNWLTRGRTQSEPRTLIGKFAAASKQKVCPLVKFSEEE